jgi:hypothetical protein
MKKVTRIELNCSQISWDNGLVKLRSWNRCARPSETLPSQRPVRVQTKHFFLFVVYRAADKPEGPIPTEYSSWSTPCLSWILVHNLPPTTTGHNDHRLFSYFPLICWCGHRHDRWNHLGSHWLQLPTHDPEEGNIEHETGKVGGSERRILHCKGNALSTTNLIQQKTVCHLCVWERNQSCYWSRLYSLSLIKISFYVCIKLSVEVRTTPMSGYFITVECQWGLEK